RDFFKLSRIELRCEGPPDRSIVVEPHVDAAPAPLPVDESDRASPVAVIFRPPPPADMEVDTRPPHAPQPPPPSPGLHHPPPQQRHEQHHHHHHHRSHSQSHAHAHQPLQQVETNRQPPAPAPAPAPPPPSAIRSPGALVPCHGLPQKSPSNAPLPSPSPAVKPVHDVQFARPPSRESTVGLANRTRDHPPVMSHAHSPAEHHRANGQYYPRSPPEVSLDALERMQTQISQNSGALSVQNRDMQIFRDAAQRTEDSIRREFQSQLNQQSANISRVDDAVVRLQHEMVGMHELLEVIRRDIQTVRAGPAPAAAPSAQDSALELMDQQLAIISHKANEVDTLKITIEIMKNKIKRLEDGTASVPQQPTVHPYSSPREPSVSVQSAHAVPSYHTTPAAVPLINTRVHPVHRPASFHSHGSHSAATPEVPQRPEPAQTQSGWVTVNASAKRAHPNGIDGPHDAIGQPVGSPKRPKLAPIEPRMALASSQPPPHQHVYDHMDTDDSESRYQPRSQTHIHTLPSQSQSRESLPESALLSHPTQHSTPRALYAPYGTQDAPSEDSWRPESQRMIEHRTPRGRGRGGGPGSRGGRGRKSMPAQIHLGTPEWEREDWQGVSESQTSPDGFYSHVARSGRGIIRRGSGGGGSTSRGRPPSAGGRAVSLGMQGVTTGVGLPVDPYAHTKKTRTKPIRNADGILIRKDGRPDMRSQSSAANLRKVHARKEEQKDSDQAPTDYLPLGHDLTNSVQKRHNAIMGKMFPGGIDESRKEHDYARKVFEEEQGHTAQPRGQHHHHHESHPHPHQDGGRPLLIKREQVEERGLDSQSPNDDDIDMEDRAEHADDEGQTPSDRSDNSAQYQDAANHHEKQIASESKENSIQAQAQLPMPSSIADSTQTFQAEPTPQAV
ncbi:hypothetical protein K491DRAFT_584716, partial [Lophiostoma macrostomum CBS 122681]